jgi:hypothetical protein
MSNDAVRLNTLLGIQLRDPGNDTWASTERDQLIAQAIGELALFGIFTALDPYDYTETLATDTYHYDLSADIRILSRVDWVDADGFERGELPDGTWETFGSVIDGTGQIHIAPTIVDRNVDATIRYVAYGVYDLAANLIPDRLVSAVLAHARAEAYRRVGSDRVRFKQLQNAGPMSNVTINELYQSIGEAEAEKDRVYRRSKTWTKPRPGRL